MKKYSKTLMALALAGLMVSSLTACSTIQQNPQPSNTTAMTMDNLTNTPHFANLNYAGSNNPKQTLDLFLPQNKTANRPLVIYIHGGAWLFGDKSDASQSQIEAHKLVNALLKQGYAVASINYRLATEAKFPAQIEDVESAMQFLKDNSQKYGLDSQRFAVMGESAGGHLTQLLAVRQGKNLKAAVSFYGVSDVNLVYSDRNKMPQCKTAVGDMMGNLKDDPESIMLNAKVGTAEMARKSAPANPIAHINNDTAPMFLLHGRPDCIVPAVQSERMAAALKAKGVYNELFLNDLPHADKGFYNSPEITAKVVAFLNRFMNNN